MLLLWESNFYSFIDTSAQKRLVVRSGMKFRSFFSVDAKQQQTQKINHNCNCYKKAVKCRGTRLIQYRIIIYKHDAFFLTMGFTKTSVFLWYTKIVI